MQSLTRTSTAGLRRNIVFVLCTFALLLAGGAGGRATAATTPGAENPWREVASSTAKGRTAQLATATPRAFKLYELDTQRLEEMLQVAPMEFTPEARQTPVVMSLPMPDGSLARFAVYRSPMLSAEMVAKYPGIETFSAQGLDDPTATARLDRTTAGFHAMVISSKGTFIIEPEPGGGADQYRSYDFGSLDFPPGALKCGLTELESAVRPLAVQGPPTGSQLRSYRMAVGLTGEFFDQYADNIAAAAADVVTTVNMLNAIFEREVAVRFNVVWVVAWNDPATDPFTNPDATDSNLLDEFEAALPGVVAVGSYDIGHLFHWGNFGGIARVASACGGPKERGASSGTSPAGIVGVMRHEVGHQMGADHTFSSNNGSCASPGQRECDAAVEPGEGNTIMSYAGACAPDGVGGRIVFFHTWSYDQITNHVTGGGACATSAATGNGAPTVNGGSDYTLPRDTPFTLSATGNDPDGDAITYSWEQVDIAPGCALPPYNGTGPIFRSRAPVSGGARTFPPMADILSGAATLGEKLPTVDRSLHFRCTVRDNRAGGGGVNFDGVTLTVSGAPFRVTSPNGGETLPTGCPVTVTWTVGGGSVAPTVDILYSTNGGGSWSTLAAGTANDGSQSVDLPCGATNQGRIQVAAVGNIFFDVSNANFRVTHVAPVVAVDVVGGAVNASCQRTVTFSGRVTDDCSVDAGAVAVAVSMPGGGATLGVPVVNKVQTTGARVDVSGSVLVSAIVGAPVTVQVRIDASDACGNPASNSNSDQVFDNTPPMITCPANVVVECSGHCLGGGTSKDDPQLAGFFAGVSATDNCDASPDIVNDAPACFPLGNTIVTFTATDNSTNSSSCPATVRVVDTTPPVITVALDRTSLWPPNHKMVPINATVMVTDICDPAPTFVLTSITSNEPENGLGDGDTAPDVMDAGYGTPDVAFQLRSERSGKGNGRKYTILYTAMDMSGNKATATVCVYVPHDQSGMAMASEGFADGGDALLPEAAEFALVVPSTEPAPEDEVISEADGSWQQVDSDPAGRAQSLDAADVDPARAYVGNSAGALTPVRVQQVDVNGDGLLDAVFHYRVEEVQALLAAAVPEDGPIGLHYQVDNFRTYLVDDIFALGAPVRLPLGIERVPVDRDQAGRGAGGGGTAAGSALNPAATPEPAAARALPRQTRFAGIYPNPFGLSATVAFDLAAEGEVRLAVYDLRGALVQTLRSGWLGAGRYNVAWDGRDRAGRGVPGGVYLVRFEAGGRTLIRKAVLMK